MKNELTTRTETESILAVTTALTLPVNTDLLLVKPTDYLFAWKSQEQQGATVQHREPQVQECVDRGNHAG